MQCVLHGSPHLSLLQISLSAAVYNEGCAYFRQAVTPTEGSSQAAKLAA